MAISSLKSAEWHRHLGHVVKHIGLEDFPAAFCQTIQEITPFDQCLIVVFKDEHRPQHIYDDLAEDSKAATLSPYFSGTYLLDPFYGLIKENSADDVYELKKVAPDEFYQSHYYKTYYQNTRLMEEIGILVNYEDITVLISLGIRLSGHAYNELDLDRLKRAYPVLSEAMKKHIALSRMTNEGAGFGHITIGPSLDNGFKNFGKDHLSGRECEIIRLVLQGHSSKAIARLLDISPDTVKVHRKNVHTKLEISSQAELFSLFLDSLSHVTMESQDDPLTLLMDHQKADY